MSETHSDIIIVGAGPAGLTLAHSLKKMGIEALILEQGSSAGYSWDHMPSELKLITYWKDNNLRPEEKSHRPSMEQVSAKEFTLYLRSLAVDLNVQYDYEVSEVEKIGDSFHLKSEKGSFTCRYLINCCGYFSNPFTPHYLGLKQTNILTLHFSEYVNKVKLREQLGPGIKKILIVGKRLSGGQLLEDLIQDPDFELSISRRSVIKHSSHPLLYNFFLRFLGTLESFIKQEESLDVPMEWGPHQLLNEGKVNIYPDIASINEKSVTFISEIEETFDSIIFATGFRYSNSYLKGLAPQTIELDSNFEDMRVQNLFYLGLDMQSDYRSRFLRGIREDAPYLAEIISQRLNS